MLMKQLLVAGVTLLSLTAQAQLVVQSGATFFIDAGATVTVQGDVTSNANITGTGKLLMKGSSLQNLTMNGFIIPNLEIDNTSNVALGSTAQVSGVLTFTNGKLQLNNYNFVLNSTGSSTGAATGKFAETNGSGEFRQEITTAGNYTLPIGNGTDYTPLQYQLTGGSYTTAFIAAKSSGSAHPAKHPRSSDYINTYWSLNRSGVSGATVTAVGTYADPSDVSGTEADIRSMTYDGANWSLGTTQDNAANTITASAASATGDLYAMNRFVLVTPVVFLQGAFNSATGLMNDRLRNSTGSYTPGVLPASNLVPTSDPYRSAPYSSFFTHVNNSVTENLTSTAVLNDLANPNENIVDWVFVELRNISSSTVAPVVQTRSALIRRDGRIVDIDGVSPVYFKNVDAGSNFAVSVRHRNHLGLSTNPASALALNLSNTTFDFTNTANTASIFGTANVNYTQITSKNVLWGGNARNNGLTNWSALNNDKDYLYITVLGSNSAGSVTGYSAGDVNLDRVAKWSGLNNDKDYIYISVLGSNSAGSKSQALPN